MAIIKQYHKDTDTTYVYESESYWDPVLKQARSKRTCIGKVDPATGEIIPTGKRGRKKTSTDNPETEKTIALSQYEEARRENVLLKERISSLEKELETATRQIQKYKATALKIEELAAKVVQ